MKATKSLLPVINVKSSRCTCALVPWMQGVHEVAAVCLCAAVLRLSGCPALSSELLPCSPSPGAASSEDVQPMFYTRLSHSMILSAESFHLSTLIHSAEWITELLTLV